MLKNYKENCYSDLDCGDCKKCHPCKECCSCMCPSGATGPTGPAGVTGPTGSGLSVYGYIYNIGEQDVEVEDSVEFSNNSNLVGITHIAGSTNVTVTNAGVYAIWYSILGISPNQFALFIGNTAITNTIFGAAAGNEQNTSFTIQSIPAGSVLTLRNHTSNNTTKLQTTSGGTLPSVNAAIVILKIA